MCSYTLFDVEVTGSRLKHSSQIVVALQPGPTACHIRRIESFHFETVFVRRTKHARNDEAALRAHLNQANLIKQLTLRCCFEFVPQEISSLKQRHIVSVL